MTIEQAIAKARKDVGVSSDDTSIGKRYVYAILKDIRTELIRQEVEKKGIWPGFPMQTLRRFKMVPIDLGEIEEFVSGNRGYKSVLPFPDIVDTKEGKIFTGIILPTLQGVDLVTLGQWINNKNRRYNAHTISAFFRNNYLYIVDYPIEAESIDVDVDAVFEDPEEVERLNQENCSTQAAKQCVYYPSLEFYMPQYLNGRFFRIVRQELAMTLGIPLDNTNDGKADQTIAQQQKASPNVQNTR